jgi:D-alanyl-D-alanine carboxypeptidase
MKQWLLLGTLFLATFAASFLYSTPGSVISPLSGDTHPVSRIVPALNKKVNTYTLHDGANPFIKTVSAEDTYNDASAYIITNYDTGDIIAEKNSKKRLSIASLTKVMTAIVALDLASPHDLFTVSRTASLIIPTKIGVKPGEKLSLNELLHASLITSANDAAEVIKNGINRKYGYDIFVKAMNEKARLLGLEDSHFSNPQGFDSEDNYSTVRDLAVLSHYALTEYPEIAEIVKKDYRRLTANHDHRRFDLYNWNGLLGVYPNVFGVKIGNTRDAGTTTIVGAERENKRVLTVVLGATNVLQRDLWASELLDAGFEEISGLKPVAVTKRQLQDKYATWKFWN